MKKHDGSLFQIGEITKIMGITRKTLLVYENAGLLSPAFKDEESGYRYYSADNMTQIRSIRSLQNLGLTLKEVAAYYYDTENIDPLLQRLMELPALKSFRYWGSDHSPLGDQRKRESKRITRSPSSSSCSMLLK